MPASALFTATAEAAVNRILTLDEDSVGRLAALEGQRLVLFLDELPAGLTLIFSKRVDIHTEPRSHPEVVADIDTNTCCIRTSVSVLPKLTQTSQLTQLIRQQALDLDGELSIAQKVAALFGQLDIDPEEWLSDYIGDIAAHQAFSSAEKFKQSLLQALERTRAGITNTITEEKPIGVGKLAMLHFSDEVSILRDDIQRFEARLNALDKEQ